MKVAFHGQTDVGLVRSHNEDALLLLPDSSFFSVIDGVNYDGARVAVDAMQKVVASLTERRTSPFQTPPLAQVFEAVNRALFLHNKQDRRHLGVCAVAIHTAGTMLAVAHVGDCRLYRYDKSGLRALTEDHSLVKELLRLGQLTPEQAKDFPHKNVITRILGLNEHVEPALETHFVEPGDLFLLCSDGLHAEVFDPVIAGILAQDTTLADKTQELIDEARQRGGRDNISVVLVRVSDA
jgi:protein phosphatase